MIPRRPGGGLRPRPFGAPPEYLGQDEGAGRISGPSAAAGRPDRRGRRSYRRLAIGPWVQTGLAPFFGRWQGFLRLFQTTNPTGFSLLAGGIVLAVMMPMLDLSASGGR